MSIQRWGVANSSGTVTNVVMSNGAPSVASGSVAFQNDEVNIGDTYDNDVWAAAPPTPPVNVSIVTNAQLKRWLDGAGKLAAAQAAVTAAGGLTLELWYGCAIFSITDPLLLGMASALNMSATDVQTAFNAASLL